jgi:hypothetical protein
MMNAPTRTARALKGVLSQNPHSETHLTQQRKLRGLSRQANYTDRQLTN